MQRPLTVNKYGSSVLTEPGRLPAVFDDVRRSVQQGHRVVAVVSAIGRETELLLAESSRIAEPARVPQALSQLLATGETRSAALLTATLHRSGLEAAMLDVADMRLIARGDRLDADPVSVDVQSFERAFAAGDVIVVPGFTARHADGGMALLGRGGSDLTAVFLAHALAADRCRLVKDTDGVYEYDPACAPATGAAPPKRYLSLGYAEAREVAGVLLQPKAIEFLERHGTEVEVTALLCDRGTTVGPATATLADDETSGRTKRAALLNDDEGLGEAKRAVTARR